jgi:REP element-mobilizing transposase RayT
VLAYCVMSNHFHILLEVPPMPADGISDAVLLQRLEAIQSDAFVAAVAKELAEARGKGDEVRAAEIHRRHTYRMHHLSEFMKSLLQRFTRWFNPAHNRSGTLWEERFKSGIA